MNKDQAKQFAKKMIQARASGFAGKWTIATFTEDRKPLTDHATAKVLTAFWEQVIASPHYGTLEKMHCEEKLLEDIL